MYDDILNQLPYTSSFRFVDEITLLNENGVHGSYTLKPEAFFYEDHFKNNPVTPGVIITEIMAQIGLVVLGIFLLNDENKHEQKAFPLLTSTEVEFFKMVLPGEKVNVVSQKQYFRFHKLKCYVEMTNEQNELVARGTFAGIIKQATNEEKI
jgi:3-hydroxyacyl-[acyl-carrier-protein] dehydratase